MEEMIKSLPEPMQLNGTLIVIAAIFLVLIFVLNTFVFKPLVEILDKRRHLIQEGEEAQAHSLKTLEESTAAYQEKLVEARRKAQSRRQEILKESEMGRNKIIAASKEEALARVQAAATDLDQQIEQAKSGLKNESRDIARRIVSAVLNRAAS